MRTLCFDAALSRAHVHSAFDPSGLLVFDGSASNAKTIVIARWLRFSASDIFCLAGHWSIPSAPHSRMETRLASDGRGFRQAILRILGRELWDHPPVDSSPDCVLLVALLEK